MQDQTSNNKITDVYAIVTNRIIEHLEKGVVPWHKTWTEAGLPQNLITGKKYRGINVWLLSALNYNQNYFLTFNQVQDLGGSVKKGEKSHEVIFWKWIEKENEETKEKERIPMLKYYRVFNISQCEGIPLEKIPKPIEHNNNPIECCEKVIDEMPKRPNIQHKEQQAYYNRLNDYVNMPKIENFEKSEDYYGALFHELVHSTGHGERLNRKELLESKGMKTDKYAIEELTAEMGASYLKSHAGIPIEELENNASYIQGWLEHLKNDKKFIVYASSQAQKATDYILNIKNEEKELGKNEEVKSQDRNGQIKDMREKDATNKEVEIER
ncbi:MAG: zincin-like metallopeptidase domain-containing protein [Bacteroidetes bacterium]|nr:zincin-like metallopeptidase domain-containing protein [Bacteroidota bacterium]